MTVGHNGYRRLMGRPPADTAVTRLRPGVLAVSVLDDVDLTPTTGGVRLDGPAPVLVPWSEVAEAVGGHEPTGTVARRRLAAMLRLRRAVAEAGPDAAGLLRSAARVLALPADHALHPGPSWTAAEQRGGAVSCGVGVTGLTADPDEMVPLPPGVAAAAGAPVLRWWPELVAHAERMGQLAVARLLRDSGPAEARRVDGAPGGAVGVHSQAVLRPVGGVDVPSLLTTTSLRSYLAAADGTGMCAVAVPMRSRGWYDLAHADPAFVAAAWSVTDPWERGLSRPALVTADEVVLARSGERPAPDLLSRGGPAARG